MVSLTCDTCDVVLSPSIDAGTVPALVMTHVHACQPNFGVMIMRCSGCGAARPMGPGVTTAEDPDPRVAAIRQRLIAATHQAWLESHQSCRPA